MAYRIQSTDRDGKIINKAFKTATDALACASELLSRLPAPPHVFILDNEERELNLDELEELAKKEG